MSTTKGDNSSYKKVVVDKLEDDLAMLKSSDGKIVANMSKVLLPPEAVEGDIVHVITLIMPDEKGKVRKGGE